MSRNVWILSAVMITVTLLTTVAVAFAAQNEGGRGQQKVTICHKGHTITVGAPEADAHLDHGDTEGACATDEIDRTTGLSGGNDLYDDSAADKLRGGPHADFLPGGRGPDRMFGSLNKDYIVGVDA